MTSEHAKIFAAKAAARRELAALPIAEKLRILDQLRMREVTLRASKPIPQPVDPRRKKSQSPKP